jgi:hypothetical protein
MNSTQHTLVALYHPMFRKGYQDGRHYYFREQHLFTDKEFVECLKSVFDPNEYDEATELEGLIYYSVGQLLGQVSGGIFPQQPHEQQTEDLQEKFLSKFRREHGAAAQPLIDTIRQFWTLQDQLAQTLDADIFEQMINRGMEKICL